MTKIRVKIIPYKHGLKRGYMFKDKDTKYYKDLSDTYKRLIKKLTFSSRIKKGSVSIN